MLTPEEYFKLGAEAMKSEVAVKVMLKGNTTLAGEILAMPTPKFQLPEKDTI